MSASGASLVERVKAHSRSGVRAALAPVVTVLARAGVSPDLVTWFGLGVTVAGAVLLACGAFVAGALTAIAGTLLDSVDGALARARGGETPWGAFLDSTTDRVADAALFLGVAWYYAGRPLALLADEDRLADLLLGPPPATQAVMEVAVAHLVYALVAMLALAGAFLVSYTRARAEGLGIECRVGWFERPERLVVLLGAALFGAASPVMPVALMGLAALSFFTAFQRVAHVRAQLRSSA